MIKHSLIKIFLRSLLLLFLLTVSFSSHSQSINASVQLDSSDFRIGDPIALIVTVSHPYGIIVNWRENIQLTGNFEKISESPVDSIQQNSFLTEKKVITITTFDTGRIETPEIKIGYRDKNGLQNSIITNPVVINVSLATVDLKKSFHSIAPPLQVTRSNSLIYFLIAAILIAGISFFIYRMRKRKLSQQSEKKEVIDKKETVMRRLQKLEEELKQKKIAVQEFYVKLTDLLREQIEQQFSFPAFEHSSPEIIRYMKQHLDNPELLERISENFELADLVKFAKVIPTTEENLSVIESALDFVKMTGGEILQTSENAI